MSRKVFYLALLAVVLYPVASRAATCAGTCTLTVVQAGDPTNTFTFVLPDGTVTPAGTDGSSYFDITGVAVTGPDGYSSSNDTLYFYPTSPSYSGPTGNGSYTGGLWDGSLTDNNAQPGSNPNGFFVADATLFSGSVSSPSFVLTALTTNAPLVNYWGDGTYNYSITDTVAPTPEPSSLMLLGTGAMGLISTYRRRKAA